MKSIEIYRFSEDGFEPKKQEYHLSEFINIKNQNEDFSYIKDVDLKKHMEERQKKQIEYIENLNIKDWEKGIFVFVGMPSDFVIDLELNHLEDECYEKRFWFKGEIKETSSIYSISGEYVKKMTVKEFVKKYPKGSPCYIPFNSITFISKISKI